VSLNTSGAAANETATKTSSARTKTSSARTKKMAQRAMHVPNAPTRKKTEKTPPSAPCTSPTEKTRRSARHARLHAACTAPCKNSRDGNKTRLLGVDPATSPLSLRCTNELGPHLLVFGRHPRAYLIRANQENSTLIRAVPMVETNTASIAQEIIYINYSPQW
jgi:hypothetical protein